MSGHCQGTVRALSGHCQNQWMMKSGRLNTNGNKEAKQKQKHKQKQIRHRSVNRATQNRGAVVLVKEKILQPKKFDITQL